MPFVQSFIVIQQTLAVGQTLPGVKGSEQMAEASVPRPEEGCVTTGDLCIYGHYGCEGSTGAGGWGQLQHGLN